MSETSDSPTWEYLIKPESKDGAEPAVRRLDVPGGWLYQVESHEILSGSRLVTRVWQPPVFVASGTCHYCELIHNCDRGRP